MNAPCRTCKAKIRWVRTPTGRLMPLDPWPTDGGNVLLEENLFGDTLGRVLAGTDLADARTGGARLYMPHHATCPQGAQWRCSR